MLMTQILQSLNFHLHPGQIILGEKTKENIFTYMQVGENSTVFLNVC